MEENQNICYAMFQCRVQCHTVVIDLHQIHVYEIEAEKGDISYNCEDIDNLNITSDHAGCSLSIQSTGSPGCY